MSPLLDLIFFKMHFKDSLDNATSRLKTKDREALLNIIKVYIEYLSNLYQEIVHKNMEAEIENSKLNKVLYFMNVSPVEVDMIMDEPLEFALINLPDLKQCSFEILRSIQSNYNWFLIMNDRPPVDLKELREFMYKEGQAPSYEAIKGQLSEMIKILK